MLLKVFVHELGDGRRFAPLLLRKNVKSQGVLSRLHLAQRLAELHARLGERDGRVVPQIHVSSMSVDSENEEPGLHPAGETRMPNPSPSLMSTAVACGFRLSMYLSLNLIRFLPESAAWSLRGLCVVSRVVSDMVARVK